MAALTTHELVQTMTREESLVFGFVMDRMIDRDLSVGELLELMYHVKDYCKNNFVESN